MTKTKTKTKTKTNTKERQRQPVILPTLPGWSALTTSPRWLLVMFTKNEFPDLDQKQKWSPSNWEKISPSKHRNLPSHCHCGVSCLKWRIEWFWLQINQMKQCWLNKISFILCILCPCYCNGSDKILESKACGSIRENICSLLKPVPQPNLTKVCLPDSQGLCVPDVHDQVWHCNMEPLQDNLMYLWKG